MKTTNEQMFRIDPNNGNTIEIKDGCKVGEVNSHCWSLGYGIAWRSDAPYKAPAGWYAFKLEKYDPQKHGKR